MKNSIHVSLSKLKFKRDDFVDLSAVKSIVLSEDQQEKIDEYIVDIAIKKLKEENIHEESR